MIPALTYPVTVEAKLTPSVSLSATNNILSPAATAIFSAVIPLAVVPIAITPRAGVNNKGVPTGVKVCSIYC